MKTKIDLKLNLKNFSGTLENGKKYRIFSKKSSVDSNKGLFKLELIVKTNDDVDGENWVYSFKMSVTDYYKKDDYMDSLRRCLLALESNLKVQLLKSTMSIAV